MQQISNLIDLGVFSHEIPPERRKLVDEAVNEDLLKKNKYANNSEYVPESVYRKILNKITDYRWSFVPLSWSEKGSDKNKYLEFVGLLIVPGMGIHTGIGSQPLNKSDNRNALAAAKTYAFKNACKEMGLAPNVGDDEWDEPVFETDVEDYIEEKASEVKKDKGKKKDKKTKDKGKSEAAGDLSKETKKRIKEIRAAYEIDSDDDLVAFLQIWNEDILDHEEMSESDWQKFFKYFDKNTEEFEDF